MALNVVGKYDLLKMNNGMNTFHQKKNKLPLISLINNQNFKLTTKKRGKVLNKPVYSGFNKNTLSSIPRDVEIILLDKNKEEIFGNNTQNILNNYETNSFNLYEKKSNQTVHDNSRLTSFISKNFNEKKMHPATTNNSTNKINSKINQSIKDQDKIKKTKDYWKFYKIKEKKKKIIPNDKKHISLDLYQSQFFPGPSDYSSDKSFDMINQQNKYRYRSLFKSESSHYLKMPKDQMPGPGSYIKIKSINDNNDKHLSINLSTKEKRFKNLFSSASLSPWYYASSSKDDIKENNNKQNNMSLFNKDLYDYKRYILREETDDKGKVRQFYVEDKSHIKKDEPLIKKKGNANNRIKAKNRERKKIDEFKFDKLLKKYIIVRNAEKEYEVPGPGQYNVYMGFDKISKDKAIEKLQSPYKQENLIPEEVLVNYARNKNNNNSNFTFFYGGNDKIDKDKYGFNGSKSCENIFYGGENKKKIL